MDTLKDKLQAKNKIDRRKTFSVLDFTHYLCKG
jgi:hypothetical protein